MRALLETCKPLEITKSLCRTWIIFTDGAFEPDSSHPATVGGVLICPGGSVMQCFGESLHGTLVDELLSQSQHPIYELEVLPLLLALQTWGPLISGSPVVFFLDNDAARAAYVKGVGATLFAESVAQKFVCLESKLKILPWFGRVPSHSNISDGPSRLDFSNPLLQQRTRVRIPFPAHFNQMGLASGVLEKPNWLISPPADNPETLPQSMIEKRSASLRVNTCQLCCCIHSCFVVFGDSHSFHVRRRNPTNSAAIYIYV